MGIDLATWRARIGLNYYHKCRPLQTRWRISGGQLNRPGVASWGVGEVMNDTPLVLKGCMTAVALSLILQYIVCSWSKLKERCRSGKIRCHWQESSSQVRGTVNSWVTLLLRAVVVVIPLLLVIAGDIETNPGPGDLSLKTLINELWSLRTSWHSIGLELGIPHTSLDWFKQEYSDLSLSMVKMLRKWLDVNPHPTWEVIITALRSPSVNERKVAAQLEAKYCIPVQHMTEEPNSPTKIETSKEPSLKTLLHALYPVRTSWYNIGLELNIPNTTLNMFSQNYSDQLDLMREMLKEWLKITDDPLPTWEAVVTALRSSAVNEKSIAAQLESKYCVPAPVMEESNHPNKAKKSEVSSLKVLLNELHPVRASWYNIGLELDIPHTELNCFKQMYSDPSDLLWRVLKYWNMNNLDFTWEAVVRALRSPIVDKKYIAEQLESKYCTPVPPEPNLEELFSELDPVHASWYKIGLQLDIHYHWLDAIELDYPDSKNRMHEMLKHWVRNAVPTWEAVVTALRSPVVGMNLVAEQLESKYCTPVQHNIMIDDHYLSICEKVMREYGKMNQTIMHCIFMGLPGVGKSSLLKRLLRIKLDPNRTSTQVVDKSVPVEIRDVSKTAAQVSGLEWQKIEDPVLQASRLIGQLSSSKQVEVSEVGDQAFDQMENSIMLASKERDQVSEQMQNPTTQVSEQIPTSEQKIPDFKLSRDSKFSKAIGFLRHVLKEKGVSGLQQHVYPWTLYLTDSGGQPEFQELLPALVAGPCVFFVVFPLDKDLEGKYEVEYMRPHEQKYMQKYLSSVTVQEDLMRSLASIACTTYKDKDDNIIRPKVILVATFKDKVPQEEDRRAKLDYINALVKGTDAFHLGMILEASENQMVFTINNASDVESEKDAKEIRDAFQILADEFKVPLPSPWLIFSILVQHEYPKDSIISKQECFKVAQECGIDNEIEFEAALQFLHRQTGVLHYYKEPPQLCQIVIKDPQHLFSRVNHLVEKTFTFDKTRSTPCTENFKKGIFNRTDYERLTREFGQSKLTPPMLLKLLEHLNVVIPLGGDRYFMPCAITHLDEDPATDHTQSTTISPLLIIFKSGYCPKGLFGVLVACIANKQVENCVLNLEESKIYRDQICFTMDKHNLILRVNPTYICIKVIPYSPDTPLSTLCTICNGVCKLILENIKIASKTLHYSENANCFLSFECPCNQYGQQEKFHPAVLREDLNNCFWCIQSKKVVDVRKQCYIWLPEPTVLEHPDDQLVHPGTKVVFRVKGTGDDIQFQWQKNRSDLCEGGRYCDTNTDTLQIFKIEKGDKGRYRCLVKNKVGRAFSNEALLTFNDDITAPTSDTTESTIKTLLEELEDISGSEWFKLGHWLGVKNSTLRDIEANHKGDVWRCKREMLCAWLQSSPTIPWVKLATTLEHMGNEVLAQKILEKYTTP